MQKIPVAWLSLIHNRRRLAASLAGVTFAVLLMFIEMGFLNGVYDSQTILVDVLDADLVMMNRQKEDILPVLPFSRRRLEQALSIEGVASAYSLYMEEFRAIFKNFNPDKTSGIAVLAYNPAYEVINIPEVLKQTNLLYKFDTALVDDHSRDLFGKLTPGVKAELNGRKINLAGTFDLGPNFRSDGYLIMSDQNFFRYFPDKKTGIPDKDTIEFGLIKVKKGFLIEQVEKSLNKELPGDVIVRTRQELADHIKSFWRDFQPIGAVFGLGAAVGFLIGVAVCYQILYTDITDNLAQYATLKALGSKNSYLVGLVTRKAVLLAIGGFLLGLVLTGTIYDTLQRLSGIKMSLTFDRALMILGLSILMCILSGLFAVRRALRLDPAELF